jgi:hypothetical protein
MPIGGVFIYMSDVDSETRQGLRILAETSKTIGTEGVARRLLKAAETGRSDDYRAAATIFNSLPLEKRESIRTKAESEAKGIDPGPNDLKQDEVYNPTTDQISIAK